MADLLTRAVSPTYWRPPIALLSSISSASERSHNLKYSHHIDFSSRRCHSSICASSQRESCSAVHSLRSGGNPSRSSFLITSTCSSCSARFSCASPDLGAGRDMARPRFSSVFLLRSSSQFLSCRADKQSSLLYDSTV